MFLLNILVSEAVWVKYGWELFEYVTDARSASLGKANTSYNFNSTQSSMVNPYFVSDKQKDISITHQARFSGLINIDLIVFRRNGLVVDYDTFYKDRSIEIEKINLSDISKDLEIPKESVRRKILELEKERVIKKTGKKMFVNRSTLVATQAIDTLKAVSYTHLTLPTNREV